MQLEVIQLYVFILMLTVIENGTNMETETPSTVAEDSIGELNTKDMNTCHIEGSKNTYKNICPEGFRPTTVSSDIKCVLVKKQTFPPTCPYPHYLPNKEAQQFIDTYLRYDSIWLQIFRNLSSGFPNFQWIENNPLYSQEDYYQDSIIVNSTNVSDKNCLVIKNETIYPVSCFEEHTVVCMYSFRQLIIESGRTVCNAHIIDKGDTCFLAHYDLSQPTCFCKRSNKFQPPKNSFCKKLAEPTLPYQTQLLIIADNNNLKGAKCWIGLRKEAGRYKWSSTNENVNYTEWAKPYNCKLSEGALKFGRYSFAGWTFQKDRTLSCAICEINIKPERPSLGLYRHYENDYKVILFFDPPHAFTSYQQDYDIYCVSDENEYGFKTSVTVDFKQEDNKMYELQPSRKVPAHYWCEAFQYTSFDVIKSNVVVTYWMFEYVHEFSIHVKVNLSMKHNFFIKQELIEICEQIKERLNGSYEIESVRPMRAYFDEQSHYMTMIAHASITRTLKTATQERLNLLNLLTNMSIITDVFSSQVCSFTTSKTTNGLLLEWPETPIGATAIPSNRLCLDEEHDRSPVTRKCEGDFLEGGKWGQTIGSCLENTTYSETTEELFGFLNQTLSADTLIDNLLRISEKYAENRSIDVHLIAQNIEKLDLILEQINEVNYSKILSNIMYFDKQTLKEAQFLLNSTDKLLSSLDNYLNKVSYTTIVAPRLITQIINLKDSNVIGTALYKETPDANSFHQYKFSLLFKNTSIWTIIRNEQLEMAVVLPPERVNNHNATKLIVTAFYNDHLFNDQESNHDIAKIISVSTSGITGRLKHPLRIFFRKPKGFFKNKNCTSWQYGINPLSVSIHGKWEMDGLSEVKHDSLELCEFYHMTHFGHLLNIETVRQERPLDIITTIGSALSLIGIIPIYATAIFFKSWRKRPGNIILLNFCTAITLQIILTFMLHAIDEDGVFCKTLGALIHYSILSEFCWMLLIAILQYNRYVAVFKPRKANILKKSLFVGWGIPLIPLMIALCTSPTNYAFREEFKFCYLTGHYFYFALLLPVLVILSANCIIFGIIIYSIFESNLTICVARDRDYKREILLAFLLFFMLGLTWLFGLLGLLGGIWATYLFCITATLRGLVLFLYFVFGNKETCLLWKTRYTYLKYKIIEYIKIRRYI